MTKRIIAATITALTIFGAAGAATATAASAQTASPSATAAAGAIIAPCTPLQDGQYRLYGRTLTECKFIPGLGFYWVKIPANSCPGASPAREIAAC